MSVSRKRALEETPVVILSSIMCNRLQFYYITKGRDGQSSLAFFFIITGFIITRQPGIWYNRYTRRNRWA